MAETDDVGKEQKLESARRFCDLMEEEEDISIAQVKTIFISAIDISQTLFWAICIHFSSGLPDPL